MNTFPTIGKLPPRRDELVTARAVEAAPLPAMSAGSIVIPEAQDRMLELIQREQLPQDVRSTLEGSLTGDLHRQQLLFQAMIDTWPRLQKALREVALAARRAPWKVEPWAPRGGKPDAKAEALAKEVEDAFWGMKPDMARGLKGTEGTVEELAKGYFMGHQVMEVSWHQRPEGWLPKCTKVVPPRFYGYPTWEEKEDRLMLDPEGGKTGVLNYIDFPAHKFLVGVNCGHPGHPTIAAPLRALTGFWLGAIYGLKWLMQYAQLFGIPFRWATYTAGDTTAKDEVVNMMRRIGSEGWAAFPNGTELNFLDSNKSGGALVQKALLDLADEQCDIFILGQTLTSSAGDKGSQALGKVHMEVRQEVVAGVCDFVGEILTHQLSASIVAVNHGESRTDVPGIWAKFEEEKDEKALAERDQTLGLLDGKFPVGKQWMYERHGVPMPAAGEDLFKDEPEPAEPAAEGPDGKPVEGPREKVAAALELYDLVTARYNPLQARVPAGTKIGGQWTADGGNASVAVERWTKSPSKVDINFGATPDIKSYLEEQRDEWRDGLIDSQGAGISEVEVEDGEAPRWKVDLADGSSEEFGSEEEAQARWEEELAWFAGASIHVDADSASLVDDNGVTIVEIHREDGVWMDIYGDPLDVDTVEIDAETRQRATRLLERMPVESADVSSGSGGDFVFEGLTGGSEPYVIKGSVEGGELKIDSMLPVDDKASFSGSSRGAGLLIETVEAAEEAGLEKITTTGGKGGNVAMTGYRTWPALGFEASAGSRQAMSGKLPPEMLALAGDPPSLLQLTSTREGRLWWRKNGEAVDMKFDLAAGSASRARLEQVKKMLSRPSPSREKIAASASLRRRFSTLDELLESDVVLTVGARIKAASDDPEALAKQMERLAKDGFTDPEAAAAMLAAAWIGGAKG